MTQQRPPQGSDDDIFGHAFRHSPAASHLLDADGRIIAVNEAWEALCDRRADDVRGRHLREFVADTFQFQLDTILAGRAAPHVPQEKVLDLLRGDGARITVEMTSCACGPGTDGRPLVNCVLRDVSDAAAPERDRLKLARRHAMILNAAPIAIVGFDERGLVTFSNPASLVISGLAPLDLHAREIHEVLHECTPEGEPVPVTGCRLCRAMALRERVRGETWFRHGDGRPFPVSYESQPYFDDGVYVGGVLSFGDIGQRMETETALRESESRLRHLFENAPVALWLEDFTGVQAYIAGLRDRGVDDFDAHFRAHPDDLHQCIAHIVVKDVNQATLDLHRARDAAELERRLPETMTPQALDVFRQEMVALAEGRPGTSSATVVRTLDGEERHVLFRVFRDPARETWDRIYVAFMDLTEVRRMEDLSTRLSTAIEQTGDSVIITDPDGVIQYCNPAFEHITGYARDEVIGQNPRLLRSGLHDQAFFDELWATIRSGQVWVGHFVNRRKDGTLFEEDGSISPVFDQNGQITNYVAVKRDVTKQLELERRLNQSQKMEAIGQLAGGVAHDFNNILHAMLGHLEFAGAPDAAPEDVRRELRQLRTSVDRAAGLTRQLLAFSRRQVLQLKDADPNDLVAQLLQMVRRVIGEDIILDYRPGPDAVRIRVDPGQIEQVLLNLCLNARDAMPDGGTLTIATGLQDLDAEFVSAHDWAAEGRYARITVQDDGCGIPEEALPQIFEPFFTTKERGRGTGLGLSTVYGTIKQHGGIVLVESEPDKGTRFTLLLPLAAGVSTDAHEARAEPPAPRGGNETILLAEDEEMVRDVVSRILARAGYRVIEAANGTEALRVLEERGDRIDLALLDLVMPGKSGSQVADHLREHWPGVPIIFNTGYSEDVVRRRTAIAEDVPLLMKPHDPRELLRQVRAMLDEAADPPAG